MAFTPVNLGEYVEVGLFVLNVFVPIKAFAPARVTSPSPLLEIPDIVLPPEFLLIIYI